MTRRTVARQRPSVAIPIAVVPAATTHTSQHASEDRRDQSEKVFDRDRFVATLATDYRLALVARTDMPFTLAAFVRPGGRDRPAVGVG